MAAQRKCILVLLDGLADRAQASLGGLTPLQAAATHPETAGSARLERSKGSSGVLVLSGGALAASFTDSDPMYPGLPLMEPLPWEGAASDPAALHSCRLLKSYLAWAHHQLAAHPLNADDSDPVNAVITQRAGRQPNLTTLERRWGTRLR